METVNVGFGDIVLTGRMVAIVVMDSGHIVLSALLPETIAGRMGTRKEEET